MEAKWRKKCTVGKYPNEGKGSVQQQLNQKTRKRAQALSHLQESLKETWPPGLTSSRAVKSSVPIKAIILSSCLCLPSHSCSLVPAQGSSLPSHLWCCSVQCPSASSQPTANHHSNLTSSPQHLSTGAFPAFPHLFPGADQEAVSQQQACNAQGPSATLWKEIHVS